MSERNISHNDNTHQKEVRAVEGEQAHLVQAGKAGQDVHALSGRELTTSFENWQQQFNALPRVQGTDKIDTSKFQEKDWNNLHAMYTELNKPGGAIDTARATQRHAETAHTNATSHLAYSDAQPAQRSRT